jgi:arginase
VTEIRVIAMPYELGALRGGVGRGPERLLELGGADALAASGARIETELIEFEQPYAFDNEVDACFELIRLVAERVRAARAAGAFPIVLSGSCFAAVGVIAGLEQPAPGVVWFDAHGDFNEPASTDSGYFDGMGLAVLTGSAWQRLRSPVLPEPVPETAVVLAGARDFDEPEERRLNESRIVQLSPPDLDPPKALIEAVDGLAPAPSGIYVHIDLDVLDSDEAPVNVYSAPGGLSGSGLRGLLEALLRESNVGAVSLTAYDPERDPEDLVPPIAARLLSLVGEQVDGGGG